MLLAKFIIKCYWPTHVQNIKHLIHSALIKNTDLKNVGGKYSNRIEYIQYTQT